MATLSKNGNASWRARSTVRKNVRQTHAGPEVSSGVATIKKDTRRWCKGKVDREHGFVVAVRRHEFAPELVAYCPECGKEFGVYSGRLWPGDGSPPSWATAEKLKELEIARHEYNAKRKARALRK
jgi:hypothetical protein